MSFGPPLPGPATHAAPHWQMPNQTVPVRHEPAATVAFTLSLISLVIWVLPAIVAIGMAQAAKRNIRASEGLRKGAGLATAAQVISAGELVLVAVGLFALFAA